MGGQIDISAAPAGWANALVAVPDVAMGSGRPIMATAAGKLCRGVVTSAGRPRSSNAPSEDCESFGVGAGTHVRGVHGPDERPPHHSRWPGQCVCHHLAGPWWSPQQGEWGREIPMAADSAVAAPSTPRAPCRACKSGGGAATDWRCAPAGGNPSSSWDIQINCWQ
ncbi:UNVERIFIED_CONTAM: hypothetical protein K2H54_067492 [Gekko kuhli]